MGTIGKYLIGMVTGAALMGGAGMAYSAAGGSATKWEPCKMTQPAPGVTQLCELDGVPALSSGARPGSASGTNGSGGSGSLNIVNEGGNPGGGFNVGFPGPGSFPGAGPQQPVDITLPNVSLPAIALPDPSAITNSASASALPAVPGLPNASAPVGVISNLPGLIVPSLPAVSIPGNLIPGGGIVPLTAPLRALSGSNLASANLPGLPSLQVGGTATTPSGTTSASVVVGNPAGGSGTTVNADVDTSAALLGPYTRGVIDEPVNATLKGSANSNTTPNGGLNAAATASADTSAANSSNPAVKVNANASAPGTAAGTNGLSVDVAANTGSEPGVSATVSGDVGSGASAATGASVSAGVSGNAGSGAGLSANVGTSGAGGIGAGVNAGSGGISANVSGGGGGSILAAGAGSGGINVGIGNGNIGTGTDPGGIASGSGAGGIASLAFY